MPENIKAGAIIRKTLAVGDALLIPKGFLHGVLTYGDTTMLSISIDKI
jgi:dTDP-4-dehydrorhamnose 3,5-epimerase-like enzyme